MRCAHIPLLLRQLRWCKAVRPTSTLAIKACFVSTILVCVQATTCHAIRLPRWHAPRSQSSSTPRSDLRHAEFPNNPEASRQLDKHQHDGIDAPHSMTADERLDTERLSREIATRTSSSTPHARQRDRLKRPTLLHHHVSSATPKSQVRQSVAAF